MRSDIVLLKLLPTLPTSYHAGLILGLRPANERRRLQSNTVVSHKLTSLRASKL